VSVFAIAQPQIVKYPSNIPGCTAAGNGGWNFPKTLKCIRYGRLYMFTEEQFANPLTAETGVRVPLGVPASQITLISLAFRMRSSLLGSSAGMKAHALHFSQEAILFGPLQVCQPKIGRSHEPLRPR